MNDLMQIIFSFIIVRQTLAAFLFQKILKWGLIETALVFLLSMRKVSTYP